MADGQRVTELTNTATALGATDLTYVVQGSTSKKITGANVARSLGGEFNVLRYGALGNDVNDTAAIDSALAAIGTNEGTVFFPDGTYVYTGSLSLAGKRCVIRGGGPKTIIKAVNQTGPVLDLTDYDMSPQWEPGREFSGFRLVGDGTSGAAKGGLKLNGAGVLSPTCLSFRNILIDSMGGIGLDLMSCYLSLFENILIQRPISAAANNVPYMRLYGDTIGNVFINVGLRSDGTADDASECIKFETSALPYTPNRNRFINCWSEYMHLAENSSIVACRGQSNLFDNFIAYDSVCPSNNTDTCVIRLIDESHSDGGSNEVRGYINGRSDTTTTAYGVIIEQAGNIVRGNREPYGYQVKLSSGVENCYVEIVGAAGDLTNPAIIDASGKTTNVLIDTALGISKGLSKGAAARILATESANLVALWPLWELGEPPRDLSGNGYHGTATDITPSLYGLSDGKPCALFNGTSSLIVVTAAAAGFNPNLVTISAWIKVSAVAVWSDGTADYILRFFVDPNNCIGVYKHTDGTLIFEIVYGGTVGGVATAAQTSADWIHVALTLDKSADEMKAYIGGVQVGSTQTGIGTWSGSLNAIWLGGDQVSTTKPWNGYMSEVAVYDKILTADQIALLASEI